MTKEQEEQNKKLLQEANIEWAKLNSMAYAYCQLAKALAEECDEADIETGAYRFEMDVVARSFAKEMLLQMERLRIKKEQLLPDLSISSDLNDLN